MPEEAVKQAPDDSVHDTEKPDAVDVKQKAEAVSSEAVKAPAGAGAAPVSLNDNMELYPDKPLPYYDIGEVKAYRGIGAGKHSGNFVALVCEPHLVPRIRASTVYAGLTNSVLAVLAEKGTVYWPPAGAERYVFVYRDMFGKKLLDDNKSAAMGWKQEQVLDVLVKPMVSVLQDFRDKDFVHGAIRPDNMFDGGGVGQIHKIVLGDCLTQPNSSTQPVLYETIERGMAMPLGRGQGTLADDLYALGVSIAVMMRHNDPLQGMEPDKIVRMKIEQGSYAAVTGKDRFKGSILELLRGLLHDDPAQRWTIEEVVSWMDGTRLSPKQAVRVRKAPRPLAFNEKKYFYAPFLAMDLEKKPEEVAKIVETEELQQWLARAFEDDEAVERVEKAVKEASQAGKGAQYNDRLVAGLSAALDLHAPIRYRGLRIMADAFGTVMAHAMTLKADIKPFVDLLNSPIVLNWLGSQQNLNIDRGALIGKFDSCRNFLRQTRVGFGVERCLYLLAPEVHCLSEKLKGYYARSPEAILHAFEDICQKGSPPAMFLDRHSIAFISVKDSKVVDSYLYDLDSPDVYKRVLGNLKCFAVIQKRAKLSGFPAVAKAFTDMLQPVYERYHDRSIREKLQKSVNRFAEIGDLVKIAGILDNQEVAQKDLAGFREAMVEYASLSKELGRLEMRLEDKSTFGKETGKETAAVVASILSAIVILVISFLMLSGNALF